MFTPQQGSSVTKRSYATALPVLPCAACPFIPLTQSLCWRQEWAKKYIRPISFAPCARKQLGRWVIHRDKNYRISVCAVELARTPMQFKLIREIFFASCV